MVPSLNMHFHVETSFYCFAIDWLFPEFYKTQTPARMPSKKQLQGLISLGTPSSLPQVVV